MQSDAELLADCLMTDLNSPLIDASRQDINSEESGYRAIHIKGCYPMSFGNVGCEIQVRTMLQDAWAVASRYDLYRREDAPEILREMARVEAMHLRAAETALECIRAQVRAAEPVRAIAGGQDEQTDTSIEPAQDAAEREDDSFVIRSSVSPERIEMFREGYLEDREKTETLRALFNRAGAFELSDKLPSQPLGFNMFLHKGPFVQGSRWVPYFTRDFAIAAERGLLRRFGEQLAKLELEPIFSAKWSDARPTVGALSEAGKHRHAHFEPSLIVLGGPFPERWLVDMVRWATPRWQLPPELQSLTWVEGAVGDIPILCIRDASGPPTISVLDLRELANLKRSRNAIESFSIREFNDEEAVAFVQAHPRVFDTVASTFEDKVRMIRLRVLLNLFENYRLDIKDPTFGLRTLIEEG
jgi:hypothetical protein